MPDLLGRPVVVENKVGALGALAVREVVNAPPGRPVYVVAPFTNVLFPSLTQSSLKIDPFKDVQAVASLASFPIGVAVSTSIGVTTPKQLEAWMRKNAEKAQVGMGGLGGQTHFLGLQLGQAVGVDATVIPYKGNAPLITDLMAGHVPIGVLVAGEVKPFAIDSRIRLIGMLTPKRSPLAPETPTFVEQGVAVDSGESWFGMWTTPSQPQAEVQKVEQAVRKILESRDVQEALAGRHALVADFRSAADTAARLHRESDRWTPTIKASGFKAD